MKQVLTWVLVLAATAAVAIGGTLAFMTDTDEDVNVRSIGNVTIEQHEQERVDPEGAADSELQDFTDNKPLYPAVVAPTLKWENANSQLWDPTQINNELDKLVTVENTGDYEAYVRTVLAFEAGQYTFEQFQEKLHLNLNQTDWAWEWVQEPVIIGDSAFFLATATYLEPLQPGDTSSPSLLQVALDSSATNDDVQRFGEDYLILAASQAMQTEGFDDPVTALETGFYKVSPEQHPFDTSIMPFYVYDQNDMMDFAARGGRGIMMSDVVLDYFPVFNRKGTVLDMNGHTIYNNRYEDFWTFIIRVDLGGELTITGNGTFSSMHDPNVLKAAILYFLVSGEGSVLTLEDCCIDLSYCADQGVISKVVQVQKDGKTIINGGEYLRSGENITRGADMLYVISGGTIEFNGGIFQNAGHNRNLLNSHDGRRGKMIIRGGTFINHNPGVSNDGVCIKVAEGYEVVTQVIAGDTYYTVVPKK